jgi:glycosyltransferase involved in cell wall biosynthesis
MKICIFTPYSLDPIHPRLEMLRDILAKHHDVMVLRAEWMRGPLKGINYLFLSFFDIYSILKFSNRVKDCDILFVQDLSLLPLAVSGRLNRKKVIYETLDHNVSLRFYNLGKKFKFLRNFGFLIRVFSWLERTMAFRFTDKVIVNSEAFVKYFNGRAEILYYSSPFEEMDVNNVPSLGPAFLYLGIFSEEKGAYEALRLQEKYGIPIFIFGDVRDERLRVSIDDNSAVHYKERLSPGRLREEIKKLSERHFLVGFSLTRPVNYSYQTQEINKDIDYLAVGAPIVGNNRRPTEEKILAGCGVFADDDSGIKRILIDPRERQRISRNCRRYYKQRYSHDIFRKKLLDMVG